VENVLTRNLSGQNNNNKNNNDKSRAKFDACDKNYILNEVYCSSSIILQVLRTLASEQSSLGIRLQKKFI
jgi:hypothetical protein